MPGRLNLLPAPAPTRIPPTGNMRGIGATIGVYVLEAQVSGSIHPAVRSALENLASLPLPPSEGRFLSFSDPDLNQATSASVNPQHLLTLLFEDILRSTSPEVFSAIPPVALEQFGLQTVLSNESGSELLARLITAFVKAYACPDTHIPAMAILEELEDLSSI